jgi:ferredoxin
MYYLRNSIVLIRRNIERRKTTMTEKRTQWLRYAVQGSFFAFLMWIGWRHQVLGGGPQGVGSVDAYCPLGFVESLYSVFTSGDWLRRTAPSTLVLLAGIVLGGLLVGRVFCGWICPLGTLGEWSATLGRRLGIRRRELPEAVDRSLRALKYLVLAVVVGLAWRTGSLAWRDVDPWVAAMHATEGWAGVLERPWAYGVLFGAVLLASLWIERFWCRYLCPLGALLAPLQKLGLAKIQRNETTCISCAACTWTCPVRLDPMTTVRTVSSECIACGRCIAACPVPRTLEFAAPGKPEKPPCRFSTLTVGLVGLFFFFGAYGTAKVTGHWATFYAPPEGTLTGVRSVEGVFGWMTFEQAAKTVGLPVEQVLALAELPDDTPRDVSMKKLDGVNDEAVKNALVAYFTSLESRETSQGQTTGQPGSTSTPPSSPDSVRGSMTLLDVGSTFGLDPAAILAEAHWPQESSLDRPLKELAVESGKEVQEIRDAVSRLLKR